MDPMDYRKESHELNLRFCNCITKIEKIELPVACKCIYIYINYILNVLALPWFRGIWVVDS